MKKSNAFLLASLAATSFLFHNQEAKAGINDECSIKMPVRLILLKDTIGRYKGDYVIRANTDDKSYPKIPRPFGRDKKRAKKFFNELCNKYKN